MEWSEGGGGRLGGPWLMTLPASANRNQTRREYMHLGVSWLSMWNSIAKRHPASRCLNLGMYTTNAQLRWGRRLLNFFKIRTSLPRYHLLFIIRKTFVTTKSRSTSTATKKNNKYVTELHKSANIWVVRRCSRHERLLARHRELVHVSFDGKIRGEKWAPSIGWAPWYNGIPRVSLNKPARTPLSLARGWTFARTPSHISFSCIIKDALVQTVISCLSQQQRFYPVRCKT